MDIAPFITHVRSEATAGSVADRVLDAYEGGNGLATGVVFRAYAETLVAEPRLTPPAMHARLCDIAQRYGVV